MKSTVTVRWTKARLAECLSRQALHQSLVLRGAGRVSAALIYCLICCRPHGPGAQCDWRADGCGGP